MLLVDHHQPQVARPGRRSPSGARRRSAPRRTAAAATRRAARRPQPRVQERDPLAEAGREPGQCLRRERDLGHQHDRPPAALERRLGGGEVDLGLARAGDAVQEQLRAAGIDRGDDPSAASAGRPRASRVRPGAPTAAPAGAGAARARRANKAAALEPVQRVAPDPVLGEVSGTATAPEVSWSSSSARRWRRPSRAIESGSAAPGADSANVSVRARGCPRELPVPGGRTSSSPRAGVEQYSRPTHSPSRPAPAAPRPRARRSARRGARARARSIRHLHHHPEHAPAPERHHQHAADADVDQPLGQPVVERPAQGPGGGERLDLGDRHRTQARAHGQAARARRVSLFRRGAEAAPRGAGDLRGPPVVAVDPRLLPQGPARRRSSASWSR